MKNPLLIIAGPTGVGKSAVALELAGRWGACILSADSMQVYRGMSVGTAQPTAEEMKRVTHHLVGHVEPGQEYNVARFVSEANAVLAEEERAGRRVIVCGGTGLFLRHLIHGIFEGAPKDLQIRKRLETELQAHGLDNLRDRLRDVDPLRESQINANDAVRVVRALEVYEVTGIPMSEHHRLDAESRQPRPACYVVLNRPRESLFARIDARVDAMLAAGWIDEAMKLLRLGIPDESQACKALGYRELFQYFRGEWTLEEARLEIQKQTRRFAKRQLTWFRGVEDARWIDVEGMGPTEIADRVEAEGKRQKDE